MLSFYDSSAIYFLRTRKMYCYVKYICDGETSIVHSSFIKDFNLKSENHNNDDICEAFWSPNEGDTPSSLLKKQGKILTVDKELELKHQRKSSTPLPGYYFANILMVAETEQELVEMLESKCGRKRKNKSEKDISQKKLKDKKVTEVLTLGKKQSTLGLFESCHPKSVFSDDDIDDDNITLKIHYQKISELENNNKILKERNRTLKNENINLKTKFEKVFELNIELQKQLLDQSKYIRQKPILSSQNTDLGLNTAIPPPRVEVVMQMPERKSTEPEEIPPPRVEMVMQLPECKSLEQEEIPPPQVKSLEYKRPAEETPVTATFTVLGGKENNEEKQFSLEEDHLNRVLFRVKPGPPGDSLFVKNLSSAVFGDETLVLSSVTGVKCNAKKDSVARPALCIRRLAYIKKLFEERINKEQCPSEEKNKRLSKLNAYIGEKIVTLGRKK